MLQIKSDVPVSFVSNGNARAKVSLNVQCHTPDFTKPVCWCSLLLYITGMCYLCLNHCTN